MNKRLVGIVAMVCLAIIIAGCNSTSRAGPTGGLDASENPQGAAATVATQVELETDASAEIQAALAQETTVQEAAVEGEVVAVNVEPENDKAAVVKEEVVAVEAAVEVKPSTAPLVLPKPEHELVIGLEINGEAKAYAIGPLNSREMVNDTVGGVPVLVTW
jgi:hypothetical protein